MAIEEIASTEDDVEGVRFTGGYFAADLVERMTFDDVVFKQVRFMNADLSTMEFIDVQFDTCDFSMCILKMHLSIVVFLKIVN